MTTTEEGEGMKLKISLLGNSLIEYEGEKVTFKLHKAEALLYYIALNGGASRDELKALFWYDKNEAQASANLRNALYLINSMMPGVLTADRRTVTLAPFDSDMKHLSSAADPNAAIPAAIYQTPLKGLSSLNYPAFNEWLDSAREKIRGDVIDLIKQRVEAAYDRQDNEALGESLAAAIRLDPFDEDSVLELMELYSNTGQNSRAVELFQNYSSMLNTKLSIAPSERAKKYYAKIFRHNDLKKGQPKFWCREREMAALSEKLAEEARCLFFIHGEAGIGKTSLINELLAAMPEGSASVLSAKATMIGGSYAYSSWNNILRALGALLERTGNAPDKKTASILASISPGFTKNEGLSFNADLSSVTEINPVALASMIAELIAVLAKRRRVVMVFEDIHWFDSRSIELLCAFLSCAPQADIIISGRPEAARMTMAMLRQAKCGRAITEVELNPFRDDEIIYICRNLLPESTIKERGLSYFVRESEGVPLMLFEILRALKENPDSDCANGLGALIIERMGELSERERDVSNAIAVCSGGPAEIISEITEIPIGDTLASAERLIAMGLVREREEAGNAFWEFTHLKLRECVYDAIPAARRKELHRRAAAALDKRYLPQHWDPALSAMLSHHYAKAGERVLELKQYLRELIFDITLNHDLFPTLSDRLFLSCSMPFSSREETDKKVEHAVSILDELRGSPALSKREYAQLEASCFELAGGYRISWGEYTGAKLYTDEAIHISKMHGFTETHIHCLKHYAYMYLQTEEPEKLISVARELLRLAKAAPAPHYFATAVRFIGMGYMMKQDYARAEKIFLYAVRLFERMTLTGRRYTLGMLVAKCYLGEIYERTGDLERAAEQLSECTGKCEEMNLYWGRSYFHTGAANVALDAGDMKGLFSHIDRAAALFESCRGGRCGSILYSTKAIADAERGDLEGARKALENSELLLRLIAKHDWVAAHHLAKAWLARLSGEDFRADAERAASEYEENGFPLRAAWIREKFGVTE